MKETFKLLNGLFAIFVLCPIWLFLIYTILSAIHPDRLVWFLFCVYVPVSFLSGVIGGLTNN